MKYTLITILAISFLISCSKKEILVNPTLPTYYMKFKVDDTLKQFKYASIKFSIDSTTCIITGAPMETSVTGHIGMAILNNSKIVANTSFRQSQLAPAPLGFIPKPIIMYPYTSISQYSYMSWVTDANGLNNVYETTIKINEINSMYVTGNFSATLKEVNGFGSLKISEGEFKALILP